ncbi:hypothetical protein GCM10025787_47190 [Saccharopolyspora rosea]
MLIHSDPFLLFRSGLVQVLLMFVITVGRQMIGQAADQPVVQTYLHAEAVPHACGCLCPCCLIGSVPPDVKSALGSCRIVPNFVCAK